MASKTPLQHSHHVVPTSTYFLTLCALTILMLATIGASYVNFPGGVIVNNLIALAIAFVKSFLVIWIFMGIKWATPLTRLWAVCGFLVLPLMFIMFEDFFVRGNEVVPAWEARDSSTLPRQLNAEDANKQAPAAEFGLRPHG